MSHIAFNPPPGWPPPPPGWLMPVGWSPPADWPEPPPGWQFFLELPNEALVSPPARVDPHPGYGVRARRSPSETRAEPDRSRDVFDPDLYRDFGRDDRTEEQIAVGRQRRHVIITAVLVLLSLLLVSSFFTRGSGGDPASQAMTACGAAVRVAVAEQAAVKGEGDKSVSRVPPRVSMPQGSNTFNSVDGDPADFAIEGVHFTTTGESWDFTCRVDATTNPPIVTDTTVAPRSSAN